MENPRCTSCDLIHGRCQCRRQTSTTPPDRSLNITPAFCCFSYVFGFALLSAFFVFAGIGSKFNVKEACNIELFANSVSVSNVNVTAADWRIGFVARSPVTGCKISLYTLKSRLFRGGEFISSSLPDPSSDTFGKKFTGDKTDVVFEKVVMPQVIGDVVIRDYGVEIMLAVKTDVRFLNGFFMATCPAIPVKLTTDPAGKVMGSLPGNMRRCEYEFRQDFFRKSVG